MVLATVIATVTIRAENVMGDLKGSEVIVELTGVEFGLHALNHVLKPWIFLEISWQGCW